MKNLVTARWLQENINNENLVIIDCRFDLMDKEYSKKAFEASHIKGAQRIDIETQLSSKVEIHGGRHPIPQVAELEETFRDIGINKESIVVCYDEGDLSGPSRLWFILKYLGHDKVYVLNEGISAFEKIGGVVTTEVDTITKGNFKAEINESLICNMNDIKERVNNDKVMIVDSREHKRYIGEFEPVDKKAGHIPGAKNYFWMNILSRNEETLTLKSNQELNEYFKELNNFDEIIVYCGSGITACTNSLALDEVGIKHKVYCGSFSDWISYDYNEVETNTLY